jgi:hypothetical protein
MPHRGEFRYLSVEIALTIASKRVSWRMRHYLDTEEAAELVSSKSEELAALTGILAHARKFTTSEQKRSAWFEVLDHKCDEISKILSAVAALAERDDLVLAALNPHGRQALKALLASAAIRLQEAKALRDRAPERAEKA